MAKKRGNGEGSISRRKNGGWIAQYAVYAAEGRKRKTLYGKTRQEVAAKLARALSDRRAGSGLMPIVSRSESGWTFFFLVQAGKMAHSTFVRYEGIANNHLKPSLGHRKLKIVTRAQVTQGLITRRKRRSPPVRWTTSTATLQKALAQAGHRRPNPLKGGKRRASWQQPQRQEGAKALSPIQVKALLVAAGEKSPTRPSTLAAVHTVLRQGELWALMWDSVDLEGGKLSVHRSLKVTNQGLVFVGPKTSPWFVTFRERCTESLPPSRSTLSHIKPSSSPCLKPVWTAAT